MSAFKYHTSCDKCGSKDNKAVYEDGSSHCFGCLATKPSEEFITANQDKQVKKRKSIHDKEKEKSMVEVVTVKVKEPITEEVKEEIKTTTSYDLSGWRNINNDTSKFYAVRGAYDESTGELESIFYPATRDGKLVGYKKRLLPKSFSGIGDTTATVELFGQFRYKNKSSKYCLITEGEQDTMAGYQMLKEYQDKRGGDYEPPVVVGISSGAQSAAKQIASNYSFFEQFTKVIYAADLDKAGQDSIDAVAKALPRGKAFILRGDLKDVAEYLEQGKEKSFINYFYNAQAWTPVSLHSSTTLYEESLKYADLDKITLPDWLSTMNTMLAGGIVKGTLNLIAAASSVGKSSMINQLLVDWIMANKLKPEARKEVFAVLSLEATAGEFATQLLSYQCKRKFTNIEDREERLKIMSDPAVAKQAKELFEDDEGRPTFLLCDDRGGSIDEVETKIEEIIRSMGVTVLVVDVLSDILSGEDISRQEAFMVFQKKLVKETGVTIINVVHVRKTTGGAKDASEGAEITDSSIIGSSTLVKSAAVVIALVRNKMATCQTERNTVKLRLLKSRHAGNTGEAGNLYYDGNEHRLVDLDVWLNENGTKEF